MRHSLLLYVALTFIASVKYVNGDDICNVESCYIEDSNKKCDRTSSECPPCLFEKKNFLVFSKYICYYTQGGSCPDSTTLCQSPTPSPSDGSGGGSTKPSPSTSKPKPTSKHSSSSSGSESGSGSSTPAPSPKSTPKTTPKPTPKTPSPTTNTTSTPEPTQKSNAESSKDESSGSKLPLIIGIAGGAVVLIAVLAFFIWKRRQDDDDSDDEGYGYNPPTKPAYAAQQTANAAPPAYNNDMRSATSPGGVGNYGGGASAGYTGGAQYGGGAHYTGKYNGAAAAGVDYGSPSTIDGSHRNEGRDSLEDPGVVGRDVWGNQPPPKPTRTHSNVSVEF